MPRSELAAKCGLTVSDQPLLLQLLKQSRQQPAPKPVQQVAKETGKPLEEKKEPAKSTPFTRNTEPLRQQQQDDEIEEDIVQDHEDIILEKGSARDDIGTSGGASSAVGIDMSIDTLKLDEYDYVEDIKITPRD